MLLTDKNIVKLADFGTSKILSNGTLGRTYKGSHVYMSPEARKGRLYEEQRNYSTHQANTDIWF